MDDQLKEDLELIDCYTSGYAAGTKELRDAFARVAAKARLGAAVEAMPEGARLERTEKCFVLKRRTYSPIEREPWEYPQFYSQHQDVHKVMNVAKVHDGYWLPPKTDWLNAPPNAAHGDGNQ